MYYVNKIYMNFIGSHVAVIIFAVAWVLAGIIAFVFSLVCAGKTPDAARIFLGILIAIFFGPLYWIYFFVDKAYCRSKWNLTATA
jgi:hypothetical protein